MTFHWDLGLADEARLGRPVSIRDPSDYTFPALGCPQLAFCVGARDRSVALIMLSKHFTDRAVFLVSPFLSSFHQLI